MPVLMDYSQVALSGMFQFQKDIKHGSDEKIVSLLRHVIISSILSNKKKFGPKYGEMIICCDGGNYWRRDQFKYYKAGRKKNRDKSDLNWKLIFDTMSEIKNDLREYFPYRVLSYDKAEADDIIAILVKYFQDNELVQDGLMTEPQKTLILSSDHDNLQLHKYSNVTQYSTMQKKFVKPKLSPHKSIIEKICTGDNSDGVPNIMSPDDVFVTEGTRQKPFRKARLEEFYKKGIEACETSMEKRNYQRNELLVSYDHIPDDVEKKVLEIYNNSLPTGKQYDIMKYLTKHRCRLLMDSITEF